MEYDQIGLILTANIREAAPYTWEHVQENIEYYESIYPRFFIIICGNGQFPKWITQNKKYTICNNPTINDSHNSIERFIELLPKALDIAENAACEKTLISPCLSSIQNLTILDKSMAIVGELLAKDLYSEMIFGKTKTLKKIFGNKKWNPVLSEARNMYQIFTNVVGQAALPNFVMSKQECNVTEKIVLSRNIIKDLKW